MIKPLDYTTIEARILAQQAEAKRTGKPVVTARQSPTGRMRNYEPPFKTIVIPPEPGCYFDGETWRQCTEEQE